MSEQNPHTKWSDYRKARIEEIGQEEYDRLLTEVREKTKHLNSTWQDVRTEVARPEDEKVITGLKRNLISEVETISGIGVRICDGDDCEKIRPGFTIHHPPCMMTTDEDDE